MTENIVKDLTPLIIDIEGINLNPANTRKHRPEGIDLLCQSLTTYGQHKPIVVQKSNMLCRTGNGVLTAALKLEWKKIAAVVIEEDSMLATAREIIDNRSAEIGSDWETEALALQLQALMGGDFDIELTGFSLEDLEAISTDLSPNEENAPESLDDLQDELSATVTAIVPLDKGEEAKSLIEEVLREAQIKNKIELK